ncbi:MAG: hypothetical protein JRJ87_21945 [Deltaproteobacteria bacterium]|nr:hypothetical protein [Deltaproteobacteria bacterium]
MYRKTRTVFIQVFAILFGLQPVIAGSDVSPFGPPKEVSISDFGPHLSDGEWYKEEWNHNVWTKEGHFIAVDFAISNIGIGDHKGAYKAHILSPDGQATTCTGGLDSDEWSWSKDGFGLVFGSVSVSGDKSSLTVKAICKDLKIDLEFKNLAPPFMPGSGKLKYGDEGYYAKLFPSARARVTGVVSNKGKRLQVDAAGVVEHSVTTVAPHKSARRWFRFRQVDENYSIVFAEVETPAKYGHSRHGWAMVYGEGGRLAATAKVRFDYTGYIKDQKSKHGYVIPRRVRIAAIDGDTHLIGTLLMTSLAEAVDPTAKLSFITRSFVRRFVSPMDYRINCSYKLRLKNKTEDKTIEGEGSYRFIYVNP